MFINGVGYITVGNDPIGSLTEIDLRPRVCHGVSKKLVTIECKN